MATLAGEGLFERMYLYGIFLYRNSFPGELDEVAAQTRALGEWFRAFSLAHMGRLVTAKALGFA
jgi:hypothetical protein